MRLGNFVVWKRQEAVREAAAMSGLARKFVAVAQRDHISAILYTNNVFY